MTIEHDLSDRLTDLENRLGEGRDIPPAVAFEDEDGEWRDSDGEPIDGVDRESVLAFFGAGDGIAWTGKGDLPERP